MALTLGESAPHPAFGHPLPARRRGERGSMAWLSREAWSFPFSPRRGEKVAEGRMRGRSRLKLTPLGLKPRPTLTGLRPLRLAYEPPGVDAGGRACDRIVRAGADGVHDRHL